MSPRKPGTLLVAPSSKPGNGTLWRDIHSIGGAYSPAYVGEAIEADAILFAAAPELLAALIGMMNRYGDKAPHPTCDASISARAAIVKAEGTA